MTAPNINNIKPLFFDPATTGIKDISLEPIGYSNSLPLTKEELPTFIWYLIPFCSDSNKNFMNSGLFTPIAFAASCGVLISKSQVSPNLSPKIPCR